MVSRRSSVETSWLANGGPGDLLRRSIQVRAGHGAKADLTERR
jgi:hypothetical protein